VKVARVAAFECFAGGAAIGTASVEPRDDALVISTSDGSRAWHLEWSALRDVSADGTTLTIAAPDVTLILAGSEAQAYLDLILSRCCRLPEVTQAVRRIGASGEGRGSGAELRDALFMPLLAARLNSERAIDAMGVLSAFDSEELERALRQRIASVASRKAGANAALQRALAARLGDAAAPLWSALRSLGEAASGVRAAPREVGAWRRWHEAVRLAFLAADRASESVAAASPPATEATR
jgi:hypothetical protein